MDFTSAVSLTTASGKLANFMTIKNRVNDEVIKSTPLRSQSATQSGDLM